MDIGKTDYVAMAESGSSMKVLDPITEEPMIDHNGKEVVILAAGKDSVKWRKSYRVMINKLAEFSQKGKKTTSDQGDTENSRLFASIVIEWDGFYENGDPLECTVDNVMKVFGKAPFILEQLAEFIDNRENFIKT